MRRARRVDRDQVAIVAALRKAGCFVEVLSDVGRGVPDLLVTRFHHCQHLWLMEIKTGNEDLSPAETRWIAACHWSVHIVNSVEAALKVIGVKA